VSISPLIDSFFHAFSASGTCVVKRETLTLQMGTWHSQKKFLPFVSSPFSSPPAGTKPVFRFLRDGVDMKRTVLIIGDQPANLNMEVFEERLGLIERSDPFIVVQTKREIKESWIISAWS
jgi:hypothetical protein